MSKNTEQSHADLHKTIAELNARLADSQKATKRAQNDASRYRTAELKAKADKKAAVADAQNTKRDALADLGPSVVVRLQKESKTGDGTVLPVGTVVGVINLHGKINTDYLVSAILTGRAGVVPGITDGVFQMEDLIALRDRNAELEAMVAELTAPETDEEEASSPPEGGDGKEGGDGS